MSSKSGLTFLDVERFCSSFRTDYRWYHIDHLMRYLKFCIVHCRRETEVKEILTVLPWLSTTTTGVYPTDAFRGRVLVLTLQYSNARKNHSEASRHLNTLGILFKPKLDIEEWGFMDLERALIIAGLNGKSGQVAACEAFEAALIKTYIFLGPWHVSTLRVLYHLGGTLRQWGFEEAGYKILDQ